MTARCDWYQLWTLIVCLSACLFVCFYITRGYGPLIACRPSLFILTFLLVLYLVCWLRYSIFWSLTSNKLTLLYFYWSECDMLTLGIILPSLRKLYHEITPHINRREICLISCSRSGPWPKVYQRLYQRK